MRKWTGRIAWGAGVALAALLASPSGSSQNNGNAVNGAQESAPHQIEMVPARAELQKGLNAKKLKPGETVTAKLEQTVNLPNEPALQRNTVLTGQVDAVEVSQHHSNSKITVTFNQAKLKDGTVLPVKVTVMKLAAPAMAQTNTDAGGPMAEGGAAPESAPSTGSGRPGGSPGMQSAPQPEPMNTEPSPESAAAANDQNGVPGVMLKSDIHQPTSATFLAKGRNVEVPGGTQMEVAIAVIPKGVQVR
jgi:hypothetical protein